MIDKLSIKNSVIKALYCLEEHLTNSNLGISKFNLSVDALKEIEDLNLKYQTTQEDVKANAFNYIDNLTGCETDEEINLKLFEIFETLKLIEDEIRCVKMGLQFNQKNISL